MRDRIDIPKALTKLAMSGVDALRVRVTPAIRGKRPDSIMVVLLTCNQLIVGSIPTLG
jgi:hypothetical protein